MESPRAAVTPGEGRRWRLQELASATGVPARTLHHYEEIGVLVPSERPQAGPRRYGEADVRRLYRIVALRRMGHPVGKISSLVGDGGISLRDTVSRHLDTFRRDPDPPERLRAVLLEIAGLLERSTEPSGDHFIAAMDAMRER